MHLKLLYNPAAGKGKTGRYAGLVRDYLLSRGADVDSHASSSADDLIRVAAESSTAGFDRVVVCGGDGTLHLAIRKFDLLQGVLGVIPLGSGDDFARVLGIPRDLRAACDVILDLPERSVDVALANGERYLGVAGLGFDSQVAAHAQRVRSLRGSWLYLYSILRVLPRFVPHLIQVTVDGVTRREEVMFAVVGNSGRYGGGIRILPGARIDDGVLDFCLVHRTSRLKLLSTLPRAYRGGHVVLPFVETGRGSAIQFDSESPLEVFADGEFVTRTPVSLHLEREKLRVVAPPAPTAIEDAAYSMS